MKRVLVTGASGYIGGRLVPRLLRAGYAVRVLARDPDRLQGRPWGERVEVVRGDVLDPDTLPAALGSVSAAYYLIHAMSDSAEFQRRDLDAARNFSTAAAGAGVKRIVYLGGLGDPAEKLSPHLRSRQETGAALREGDVPVTEFRAGIVVGAGSASFEMIRDLTERLPVMVCPRWVFNRVQPIAVRDVLAYLLAALETPESAGQTIEIGGADVLTYGQMMLGFAKARGLRRWLISVPVLTPRLSSYWVHLVTPVPARIAAPLIEGLKNEVIVRDQRAQELFPHIEPVGYQTALGRALRSLEAGQVETTWSDALASSQGDAASVALTYGQGMVVERRERSVAAPPDEVFRVFVGLGGQRGWLYGTWLWRLRGSLDRLVGGVGFRRGRRHPDEARVGDAIDFWRVEWIEPGRSLRLRAEMKLPGRAWLQFDAEPQGQGARLIQRAFFAPKGLAGLLYWYALYPVHGLIFSKLCQRIAQCVGRHTAP